VLRRDGELRKLSVETRTKSCAAAYSRIFRSPIPLSPFRRALSDSGNRSRNNGTSRGDRLSSKRSFTVRRLCFPPPVRRHKRTRQGSHPARVEGSQPGFAGGTPH